MTVTSHPLHPKAFLAALLLSSLSVPWPASAGERAFSTMAELDPPTGPGAREPSLFAMEDGRVLMSWSEPEGEGMAVRMAIGGVDGWSEARTVVAADDLFVNWADFPSVAAFPDGTLAAHWLKESGGSGYDYDVNLALSDDEGRSWSEALIPHDEKGQGQHGFATLLPMPGNRLLAVWLDGRAYGAQSFAAKEEDANDAMQLRARLVASDGAMSEEMLLDARTCTCCQTSAAVTGDGTVLVAYRDRTEGEIRDISVVRLAEGAWTDPVVVHEDGWVMPGCPVNGPAIDVAGTDAVVAWFTAAGDDPAVKFAFSADAGMSFGEAFRVDRGEAAGRVDAVMSGDDSALISWVEWTALGEVLYVCRAVPQTGCAAPQAITLNRADGSINFPRMVRAGEHIYIAWSQPGRDGATGAGREPSIRLVVANR